MISNGHAVLVCFGMEMHDVHGVLAGTVQTLEHVPVLTQRSVILLFVGHIIT